MRIGIVGTGHLAAAVVTGLCQDRVDGREIVLSPRNAEVARSLAERFTGVSVAADNDAVVRTSDLVLLAVRPDVAEEVVSALPFEASQLVISLMALVSTARLEALVRPAQVVRTLCLPTVARRRGSVVVYPGCLPAERLFAPLGEVHVAEDEEQLELLWASTGMMAGHFELLSTISGWLTERGVSGDLADRYTKRTFAALSQQADEHEGGLVQLVAQAQTPRGLNAQALARLRGAGVFQEVRSALDDLAERILRGPRT